MAYNWTALQVIVQLAGELGLPIPTTLVGSPSAQTSQMLALLNSAGAELLQYYPWEQLATQFNITSVASQESYPLPDDYAYFRDQTQWDASNHWPLLGPKSAQEWAWLKNSFVASLPRMRYRIQGGVMKFFPIPTSSDYNFYMEYISRNWVTTLVGSVETPTDMIALDADILKYDPWLLIKFTKLKFYQLKGFNTAGVSEDFQRCFDSLTGKDTGAEKLSLAPTVQTPYVGPWSIPDGSWQV